MIKVTDINGVKHILNPVAVSQIIAAGYSGQWHGINSYVKLFDGTTIEARETVDQLWRIIAAAPETKT